MKELTELPEKWCVEVTKENIEQLITWRNQGDKSLSDRAIGGYLYYNKIWKDNVFLPPLVEISFEQFKKWILKEEIKPWSVGTYVVITGEYHTVKIGEVHKICDVDEDTVNISKSVGTACSPPKSSVKWFATLKEAEEFSKTLTKTEVSMNDSDLLLEEAKRRYTVGTTYKGVASHLEFTIKKDSYFQDINFCKNHGYNDGKPCMGYLEGDFIFYNNQWAEIVSTPESVKEFKSERFVETMKFFNQLQEPYKSQAIANYDEEYDDIVPRTLYEAITYGFEWEGTGEEFDYWDNFRESLNTPFSIKEIVYNNDDYDSISKALIENSTKTEPKLLKIDFKSKTIVKEEKLSSIIKLVKPKQILKIK